MLIPREIAVAPEEIQRIQELRERQREYEERLQRENEELRAKIGAALLIQHYTRFRRCRARYLAQLRENIETADTSFVAVQ